MIDGNFKEWYDFIYASLSKPAKLSNAYLDLIKQINSIKNTGLLNNGFQDKTDEFIDNYSPRIILEILNLTPVEQSYAQQLNQILEAYISLIPQFLLTNHKKFSKISQRIITERDYPFYSSTVTNSFSFLSSSPYYTSNLKMFLNSDILNICRAFFEENKDISTDIFYIVIYLINHFRNQWDKKILKSFYTVFTSSFLEVITKLDNQVFRNLNENQITSIFTIIQEMAGQEVQEPTIQQIIDVQMNFCVRMLNSEYLSKQFCAIQTFQSADFVPDAIFEQFRDKNVLDCLFSNLHKDLFPGYSWLLKTMIKKGYADQKHLLNLWEVTLSKYTSSIDTWSDILSDLDDEIEELFWQKVAKTRSFPLPVYPFLRNISSKANESQKKMIFQCLFQQVFTAATTPEAEDAIVLTIAFYLPKDPDFRSSAQDQCIDLIKNELHIGFALSVLKKLAFHFNSQESRELFHTILEITPDLSKCTEQYMEFLVSDMRHFDSVLTEHESNVLELLLIKILPGKSAQVQKFFEDIVRTQKIIFPTSFFTNSITKLCQINHKSEPYVNLLISLFKEVNRKFFESSMLFNDLWIRTVQNLICVDEIWNFLYKTSSLTIASFLSKLYSNCREIGALRTFVNNCLKTPANNGALMALVESIERREGISAPKMLMNRWKTDNSSLIQIKSFGDFTGTFLLPPVIQSQALKSKISNFLLVRTDALTIHMDGKTLPSDLLSLTPSNTFEIKIIGKDLLIPTGPTSFLVGEKESKYIVSLLSHKDQEIAGNALKIANFLPTIESESEILNEKNINWETVFDTEHKCLLLYRLNAIGNLLQTEWHRRFVEEKGAIFLYHKLVIENHLYRDNEIVLKLLNYLVNSDDKIFTEFDRNEFETLIDLIFSEVNLCESNAELLYSILRCSAEYNSEFLFPIEKFNDFASMSIFHHNQHFRKSICSIIKLDQNKKEMLLKLLPISNCAYCHEFYELLETSIEEINDDCLSEQLTSLLISHFSDIDDIEKLLFVSPPHEPFVKGIISILYKLNSFAKSNSSELLQFLLKNIAFHPVYYFPLDKKFFDFLKELMNYSTENEEILFDKISSIHSLMNITRIPSRVVFTASHDRKGLRNLGATCYANSVLQQLFNATEFRTSFLSAECEKEDWAFALQVIFAKLLFFPALYIDTSKFFKMWKGWDGQPTKTHEQQDAVEFLQLVLDKAEEKIKNISDIFKGKFQHDTLGVDVEYHNVIEEDFTTLNLEVVDQRDIEDSFTTFLLPDYHNDYNAEGFGKINVQRFHKISKSPEILIIQLKRFTYDLRNHRRVKVSKNFLFPHQLDMTRLMTDQSQKIEYDLIGVVVHVGNASAGHYFSYCKVNESNEWICCNDSSVKGINGNLLPDIASGESSSGESRDGTAYILFYRRRNSQFEIPSDKFINQTVVSSLVSEIKEALHCSVLTGSEYSRFIFDISDTTKKGPFLFTYIVKCLKACQNESLFSEFIAKICKFVEESHEFADFVLQQYDDHISMLLYNSVLMTREKYSHFLCHSMEYAKPQEVQKLIQFLISKLSTVVEYWSNFDHFFLPFLQSVLINSGSDILPVIFDFLQIHVPQYVKDHPTEPLYQRINLNNVFKLLVVLLSSSALKNDYKKIIFSHDFLNKWIQSPFHAVAFSQLLRSFVVECPELSSVYFEFLIENAADLSPESTAGHFAVLINSQAMCNDGQVMWCLKFLKTKSPAYIRIFFDQLAIKIVDSKIDFTMPLIAHGDIWVTEWLFSIDKDLRKSMRKLVMVVFNDSNVHLIELLRLLLSKLKELSQLTTKRKRDLYLVTHGLTPEYSLPTNTFYTLLTWTVKKGNLNHELCDSANQLVDTLIAHKGLQMRDNFPQQRLMSVLALCNNDHLNERFFQIASAKKYLSAFSNIDFFFEENVSMAFEAIKFVPYNLIPEIAKSDVFEKLSVHCFTSNRSEESQLTKYSSDATFPAAELLSKYIFVKINQTTAPFFAPTLWQRCFHKVLLGRELSSISRQLLTNSPETSNIFMKMKCHLSIVEHIKMYINKVDMLDPMSFELLRVYTDSFRLNNDGKYSLLFRTNRVEPLIKFWGKYRLMLADIVSLILRSNSLEEIEAASSLLRCVSLVDEDLAIFIFEQFVIRQGKMLLTTNNDGRKTVALLIDVVCETLINNNEKRQRAFRLMVGEFCSLIDANIFDHVVLDSLNRKINIFIDIDSKLKLPELYFKKYEIWKKKFNTIV